MRVVAPPILADLLTVFGVPAHPLLIHLPVVFVPLTTLGIVVSALRPRVLEAYGWLVVIAAVIAAAGAIAAKITGRQLFESYGQPEALAQHQRWGEITRGLSVLLAVLAATWWWHGRKAGGSGLLGWVLRVAVVAVAVAALAAVTYTGHLGAESVWGDVGG